MLALLRQLTSPTRRNEEGASAVEYGLLVALIAAIIVAAVFLLGSTLKNTFNNTCDSINRASCTPASGAAT